MQTATSSRAVLRSESSPAAAVFHSPVPIPPTFRVSTGGAGRQDKNAIRQNDAPDGRGLMGEGMHGDGWDPSWGESAEGLARTAWLRELPASNAENGGHRCVW